MPGPHPLQAALWLCHAALLTAAVLGVATARLDLVWRVGLLAAVAAPLLLSVPGLYRGRRYTYQWLALALVFYAGAAAVEVVAAGGAAPFAAAALLASLGELAVLFLLNRKPCRRPAAARGRSRE